MRREVPSDTTPVTIAPVRLLSSLLKIATVPPITDMMKAMMHAAWRINWEFLLTLMKKETKKATPTTAAIVCLSLLFINTAAKAPITAMTKDTMEINSPTFSAPLLFSEANRSRLFPLTISLRSFYNICGLLLYTCKCLYPCVSLHQISHHLESLSPLASRRSRISTLFSLPCSSPFQIMGCGVENPPYPPPRGLGLPSAHSASHAHSRTKAHARPKPWTRANPKARHKPKTKVFFIEITSFPRGCGVLSVWLLTSEERISQLVSWSLILKLHTW